MIYTTIRVLIRIYQGPVGDNLGGHIDLQYRTLHETQELIWGLIPCNDEIGYSNGFYGPMIVTTWYSGIDRMWDIKHCILHEPFLSLGDMITGTGPLFVISGIGGGNKGKITIGTFKDILVSIGFIVPPPSPPRKNRVKQ